MPLRIRFNTVQLFLGGAACLLATAVFSFLPAHGQAVDIYVHDTYLVLASSHAMLFTAVIFGIFAGIYCIFPRVVGRRMNEPMGKLHFWVSFLGVLGFWFSVSLFARMAGSRHAEASFPQSLHTYFLIASLFALAAFVVQAIFLVNFFWSIFRGTKTSIST